MIKSLVCELYAEDITWCSCPSQLKSHTVPAWQDSGYRPVRFLAFCDIALTLLVISISWNWEHSRSATRSFCGTRTWADTDRYALGEKRRSREDECGSAYPLWPFFDASLQSTAYTGRVLQLLIPSTASFSANFGRLPWIDLVVDRMLLQC